MEENIMRKLWNNKLSMVLAAAVCACGLSGCYIDSNCIERDAVSCSTECSPYCSYETVCNGWECWDEETCWSDCYESCHSYTVCEKPRDECYYDRDCGANAYCDDGICRQNQIQGNVAMCGACSRSADCRDPKSACVALESGEQACMSSCQKVSDCANGFACVVVTDDATQQSLQMCIPTNGSCDANYCNRDSDCGLENASCVDHTCVLDMNVSECNNYKDCQGMQLSDGTSLNICIKRNDSNGKAANYCTIDCYSDLGCDPGYYCHLTTDSLESGVCFRGNEQSCNSNSDCTGDRAGLLCRNGKCMKPCSNDDQCASAGNAFYCSNGVCQPK